MPKIGTTGQNCQPVIGVLCTANVRTTFSMVNRTFWFTGSSVRSCQSEIRVPGLIETMTPKRTTHGPSSHYGTKFMRFSDEQHVTYDKQEKGHFKENASWCPFSCHSLMVKLRCHLSTSSIYIECDFVQSFCLL